MPSPDRHALTMLVRKLESVAGLSAEERQAILSLPVRIHVLEPRQDIVRDGDEPLHCSLIVEGWAYRYKLVSEGRRQIFSFHIAGDVPDADSLCLPTMDYGIATATRTTVAFITHETLRVLKTRFPNIAALLWRDTLIDAAIFRAWMIGMGRRSAYERVAHLFCEMYLKLEAVGLADEHRCAMPLKQADLADSLGLSTVHVNRVLQAMRGNGLITLRGNALVIEAWDDLIKAGEFDPTYLRLEKRAA